MHTYMVFSLGQNKNHTTNQPIKAEMENSLESVKTFKHNFSKFLQMIKSDDKVGK